jgi:hypothetical protein
MPSGLAQTLLQLAFEVSSQQVEQFARAKLNMSTARVRGSMMGEAVRRALTGPQSSRGTTTASATRCYLEAPMSEVINALVALRNSISLLPVFIEDVASARVFVEGALTRDTSTARDTALRVQASVALAQTVFLHASALLQGDIKTVTNPRALDHYTYAVSTTDDGYLSVVLLDSLSGGVMCMRTRRTADSVQRLSDEFFEGVVRQLVNSANVSSDQVRNSSFLTLDMVSRYSVEVSARDSKVDTPQGGNATTVTDSQRSVAVAAQLEALRATIDAHFLNKNFVPAFGLAIQETAVVRLTWASATNADDAKTALVWRLQQGADDPIELSAVFDEDYGARGAFRLIDEDEDELRSQLDFALVNERMQSQVGQPTKSVPLMAVLGFLLVPQELLGELVLEQSTRIRLSQERTEASKQIKQASDDPYGDFSTRASVAGGDTVSPLLLRTESNRNTVLANDKARNVLASPALSTDQHIGPSIQPTGLERFLGAVYGFLRPPAYYYDPYYSNPMYVYGPSTLSSPYYGYYYPRYTPVHRRRRVVVPPPPAPRPVIALPHKRPHFPRRRAVPVPRRNRRNRR